MEFSIFNLQIASASAAQVIADHQASRDEIMPPVSAAPTKNSRVQALQRLAIQKGRSFSRLFFSLEIFDNTENSGHKSMFQPFPVLNCRSVQ